MLGYMLLVVLTLEAPGPWGRGVLASLAGSRPAPIRELGSSCLPFVTLSTRAW